MPSLVAFGQRWGVGGDDLYLPSFIEGVATGSWLAAFASTYIRNRHTYHFEESGGIKLFYIGGICMSSANLVLLGALAHYSLKGTLINPWPRRDLPRLLSWKMGFGFLCLFYAIPSTYFAFFSDHPSEITLDEPLTTMKRAVLALWVAIFVSGFTWRKALYPLHTAISERVLNKLGKNFQRDETWRSTASKTWHDRLEGVMRLLRLKSHPEITKVGQLFTDLFQADEEVDIVPTDVMAGLILLDHQQTQQIKKQETTPHVPTTPVTPAPWMTLANCAHYAKYGAAVYGWPYYVMESPVAVWGLLKVVFKSRFTPRDLPGSIVGDNTLLLNTTVIKLVTGLTDRELFHVSYQNRLFEIPFIIALDHKTQAVVVAIRGTLSMEDILIDLVAFESEEIPIPGFTEIRAHQGILLTAQNIRCKLLGLDSSGEQVEEGLLARAWKHLEEDVGTETAQHYELVITGQSLGAGAAAILALLLKQEPQYKDILQCYAFSPPGGLMRLPAARYCEDFVCSVILGDDIVGRLSLHSIHDIRVRVLALLRDCDVPKHQIFGGWLRTLINQLLGDTNSCQTLPSGQSSWKGSPEATTMVQAFQSEVSSLIETCQARRRGRKRLYPPGVVIHIKENAKKRWFRSPLYSYTCSYLPANSPQFEEILVTTNMIRHHTPYLVAKALAKLSLGDS